MRNPWLSWSILTLAYLSYGQFLHDSQVRQITWLISAGFAIALAGAFTLLWTPTRRVILKGFQSDVGYSIMVLLLATAAVVAVVQFRVTAYILVLLASTLLARVDTLIQQLSNPVAFSLLTGLSLLGMGLSWLPLLFAADEVIGSLL